MTTMGVLAVAILASLLLALLDMCVYREAFGSAFNRQTPASIGWQTYFMVIAAFIIALSRDLRGWKRARCRKKPKVSSGEQHDKRISVLSIYCGAKRPGYAGIGHDDAFAQDSPGVRSGSVRVGNIQPLFFCY